METGSKDEVQKNRIRFLNAINEGHRFFSFVHCPTKTSDVIVYGWINNLAEVTHRQIYEEAVQEYGFNEKYEPVGGGSIDITSCEYRPSLLYGPVDERIEKAAFHKARCEGA